jgi:hypothetical protein
MNVLREKIFDFLSSTSFKLLSQVNSNSVNNYAQFLLGAAIVISCPGRKKSLATPLSVRKFEIHTQTTNLKSRGNL